MDSYDDYPDPEKDSRAFVLKCFQNNPINAALRSLIDQLRTGGLSGAGDDLIDHLAGQLDPMKRGTTPLEDRKAQVTTWLKDISERYGQEETVQLLIRQFERTLKTLTLDEEALRYDGSGDPPIDQEYYALHRKNIVFPTLKDAHAKRASLEKLVAESSMSPEQTEAVNAIQSVLNGIADSHLEFESQAKLVLEKLKHEGLTATWDEVTEALTHLCNPFNFFMQSKEELQERISNKLRRMLDNFGAAAVEEQLIQRFSAIVEVVEREDPTITKRDYGGADGIKEAFIDLFS